MFTTCRRDDCAYGIVHYDITLEAESWSRPGEYNQVAAAQRISAHTTPATTKATFNVWNYGRHRGRVCATALSGLQSCAVSKGFLVDSSPPSRGTVCLMAGAAEYCSSEQSNYTAVDRALSSYLLWTGFDDVDTGIAGYQWAIGSYPGGSDLRPWEFVTQVDTVKLPSEMLPTGYSVITVSAINRASMETSEYLRLHAGSVVEFPASAIGFDGLAVGRGGIYFSYQPGVVMRVRSADIVSSEPLASLVVTVQEKGGVATSHMLIANDSSAQTVAIDAPQRAIMTVVCIATDAGGNSGPASFAFSSTQCGRTVRCICATAPTTPSGRRQALAAFASAPLLALRSLACCVWRPKCRAPARLSAGQSHWSTSRVQTLPVPPLT